MPWFFLALTAALSQAGNDAISKRFFSDLTAYEMGLIRLLYALPYLLAGLIFVPCPPLDKTFWLCIAFALPLELIAFLCHMRAIKISPLSLTLPFLAFTPAFVILTGFFILNETLNIHGILGIILIAIGSYAMNLSAVRRQWLSPVMAIFKEQGSWLMLLTALIYSFTATIGKLAITHSSPQFFAVTYFLFFTILVISLYPVIPRAKPTNLFKKPLPCIAAGMMLAAMIFSHTYAISLIEAAYMLSVKRTSILFGVFFGALLFKEGKIRERLLGTSVMMCGVLIIGLFG
ncbi:MAG: EamA family transporter [Deltaproteobacteria bacterium]|nr:EamA family transporter [Deltaproteobacteria bacterium]